MFSVGETSSLWNTFNSPPDWFQPRRPISAEISHLRGRYYSAEVGAQAQVHSLFLYFHNPMGRHDCREIRRRTNGLPCFPRHGTIIPPTSRLCHTTEKFLLEKPNSTFAQSGSGGCACDHETNGAVKYKLFISMSTLRGYWYKNKTKVVRIYFLMVPSVLFDFVSHVAVILIINCNGTQWDKVKYWNPFLIAAGSGACGTRCNVSEGSSNQTGAMPGMLLFDRICLTCSPYS